MQGQLERIQLNCLLENQLNSKQENYRLTVSLDRSEQTNALSSRSSDLLCRYWVHYLVLKDSCQHFCSRCQIDQPPLIFLLGTGGSTVDVSSVPICSDS